MTITNTVHLGFGAGYTMYTHKDATVCRYHHLSCVWAQDTTGKCTKYFRTIAEARKWIEQGYL